MPYMKKLLETSALLVVTSALLVVTRSYERNSCAVLEPALVPSTQNPPPLPSGFWSGGQRLLSWELLEVDESQGEVFGLEGEVLYINLFKNIFCVGLCAP